MTEYTIERGPGVRERMDLLATVHGPATFALFDALDVPDGARALDLGCGGGHVTRELARRGGPTGYALGIDLDDAMIELARARAADEKLGNVEFRVASVEDIDERGFDLAYARLLLVHLGDPATMLRRMAQAVRGGGLVVIEDANFAGCFTSPSCPAYDAWVAWYQETIRRSGGDPELGLRLPNLLRSVGLQAIGVHVAQPAYLDGPYKQLQQMSMAKTRAATLSTGVATAHEYDAAHAELKAFTDDPTTLVAAPRMIQVWGRQP